MSTAAELTVQAISAVVPNDKRRRSEQTWRWRTSCRQWWAVHSCRVAVHSLRHSLPKDSTARCRER